MQALDGYYLSERDNMSKRILFIGGSPCSGKSTAAELISKEYGAYYFKVDDHLGELIAAAAAQGKAACAGISGLSADGNWLREPRIQCEEEFRIYGETAPFIFDKIGEISAELIITEGAAYTPQVMKAYGAENYIAIIPSPEFQISHYKQRKWVKYVLAECSDKEKAFDNWMQRDILFAQQVKAECEKMGIPCMVNDGTKTVEELYQWVKTAFGL